MKSIQQRELYGILTRFPIEPFGTAYRRQRYGIFGNFVYFKRKSFYFCTQNSEKPFAMRKTFLLIISLFFALGMASAQDVYVAGNGNGTGKIWKNDSLVHSISDTVQVYLSAMQIAPDGSIFAAGRAFDTATGFMQGRVWLNDSLVFAADSNTIINALRLNGNDWIAAGGNTSWLNGEILHEYRIDSTTFGDIYALAIDTTTGDIFAGGSTSDSLAVAAVWKNDSLLWLGDNHYSCILDLCHDSTDLYAAGYFALEGLVSAALWQNDSIIFSVGDLETDAMFSAMNIHDGSIYLAGYIDDSLIVWQDGEVLYSHPFTNYSEINALVVNEFGVYYAGLIDSVATVWKDGEILFQLEDCQNIAAIAVLPPPPVPEFTLTVMTNDTLWGNVLGGGVYPLGDTATIEAFPIIGCEFLFWNDSITDNPRNIVVTQDSTFTAHFGLIEYLIEVTASPDDAGTVTGGGIYHYGDTATLIASPFEGFEFLGWSDSIADNPRAVIVAADSSFTALFGIRQCSVEVVASPEGAGIMTGSGSYTYGTTIEIEATALEGHDFLQWADGIADNPRSVIIMSDTTFIAEFSTYQYEITTDVAPENGGTVTGGGTYGHGSVATLTATPNPGFSFVCWHDGMVSNPRLVTVTQDGFFKAMFSQDPLPQYTVEVVSADTTLGLAEGGGMFEEGSVIEIKARPKDHAVFLKWNDGITDNPRTITVTHDMTFTVFFEERPTYSIRVVSDNPLYGSVYGGGMYYAGTEVLISATPNVGCHFIGWQDGDMSNPRTVVVSENAVYTAYFDKTPVTTYSVSITCNPNHGFILGTSSGEFAAGSTINVAAIEADGYRFMRWSDGITDNPRQIVVDHDITLTALFESVGIDESQTTQLRIYPNPASDAVRIEGMEGELKIFNANGLLVKSLRINGDTTLSLAGLPAGVYFIGTEGRFAKLIKK